MFNQYAGLLSEDEQNASRNNLLLNFGLGLLANSENGSSFGQAAGRAGLGAMQQQNQFSQQQLQNKLAKQKMEQEETQRQMLPKLVGQQAGPVQMGPPTEDGRYGRWDQEGTGLLGGKLTPQQFYASLSGLGGDYTKLGLQGLGVGSESPASIKEYEYFNKLPKPAQDQFLGLKRQGYEVTNIAGVPTLVPRMPGGQVVPLSTLEKEATGKATIAGATKSATERASAQTEADINLGGTVDEISKMRTSVNDLLDAPGFDTIYGASGVVDPRNYIPGTDASNAIAKREQLDAMSFGVSIQKMKGTGSLSDAEGKKVSAAYTRATNPKISKDEARAAWSEVLQYLDTAEQRALSKAGRQNTSGYNPNGSSSGKTVKWGDLK